MLLAIVAAIAGLALLRRIASLHSGGANASPQPDSSDGSSHAPSTMQEMEQAIFQFEGGQPGDINFDNMNPGNLKSGPGMTGTNRGYATFNSFTGGFAALQDWITRHAAQHPDWDFYDMMSYYLRGSTTAPTSDAQGNSDSYADYVAQYLGVPATTPVSQALGG